MKKSRKTCGRYFLQRRLNIRFETKESKNDFLTRRPFVFATVRIKYFK